MVRSQWWLTAFFLFFSFYLDIFMLFYFISSFLLQWQIQNMHRERHLHAKKATSNGCGEVHARTTPNNRIKLWNWPMAFLDIYKRLPAIFSVPSLALIHAHFNDSFCRHRHHHLHRLLLILFHAFLLLGCGC